MKSKHQGIARYISTYVVIFLLVLLALFGFSIQLVYNWGSDDTIHYFMTIKAENLNTDGAAAYSNNMNIDKTFQFYSHPSRLPEQYWNYFPGPHQEEELLVHESAKKIIYLLPYQASGTKTLSYISHHYFPEDDDYQIGLSVLELTFLLGLFSLIVGYGLVLRIARSLIEPVQKLADWSHSFITEDANFQIKAVKTTKKESKNQAIPELKFSELSQVAEVIDATVKALRQKNEQEKHFLRCLSHELRTPLAITKASLELIAKTAGQLPDKLSTKLNKIQRANENMCSTSETLLWLWSGNKQSTQRERININTLIHEIVKNHRYLISQKNISINIDIAEPYIETDIRLLKIVLRNLIRNSFQYTQDGIIKLKYLSNQLSLSNPMSNKQTKQPLKNNAHQEFGFGVGLYLVNNICKQLDWRFKTLSKSQYFVVEITF